MYCVISISSNPNSHSPNVFDFVRSWFLSFRQVTPVPRWSKDILRYLRVASWETMRICPGRFRRNSIVCWLRTWAAMPKLTTWIKPRQDDGSWVISESYGAGKNGQKNNKTSGLEGHPNQKLPWGHWSGAVLVGCSIYIFDSEIYRFLAWNHLVHLKWI